MARVGPQRHRKKNCGLIHCYNMENLQKKAHICTLFNVNQIGNQHIAHIGKHLFIFLPYTSRPYRAIVRERE